jgi:lipid-binding SYLF domain-containing protein
MKRQVSAVLLCIAVSTPGIASASPAEEAAKLERKLTEATAVYHELVSMPDRGVPKELLEKCQCIAVLPGVLKAALGYGARHGGGVMACRTATGWSAPAFVNISGGSVGLQMGAESTDLALFFMNDRGARSLVNGSRITIGGKASVAAGPFGRSAEAGTNLELKSEIYSYARSKGLFAGLSLEGARLAPNQKRITRYYGPGITYKTILFGTGSMKMPPAAEEFRNMLPPRDIAANR